MNRRISVTGLGYVGLPVAIAFAKMTKVIGFDVNQNRIDELSLGMDSTLQISSAEFLASDILFTSSAEQLAQADFHIVTVPTPIDDANQPDLTPLLKASESLGKILKKGDIVVYESTVYPGATEEECVPVLEQHSHLKCGEDFFVGYSPERINPGDKINTFTKIKKIVSAQTSEILDIVAEVYASVITAGIHKVNSIKVAEAAKVIENSQRDLNIAFVNELSKIFNLMDIDTDDVLDAAATKWNFVKYKPGLVGGHCIGVDPYYLTHKAQKLGYHPEVLLSGRKINDGMAKYVAQETIKEMIQKNDRKHMIKNSVVAILGVTFKENCPDIRNSKVFDLISELAEYGLKIVCHDPVANAAEVKQHYGIDLISWDDLNNLEIDTAIVCVGHDFYREGNLPQHEVLIDIKGLFPKKDSQFKL